MAPTWHDSVDSWVVKNYGVGERFSIEDAYDQLEEDLARAHPNNRNVRATIRDVLQDLRSEERIEFQGERGTPMAGWYERKN